MEFTKSILLSTAYLGPVRYFAAMIRAEETFIEAEEHYIKQTWRNRCRIVTANGILNLTIPVIKVNGNHTKIKDIQIAYTENWQQLHWRAIESAYKHSPYFQYFEDDLKPFYHNRIPDLLDFNLKLTQTVLQLAGIKEELRLTADYKKQVEAKQVDLRNAFSPKTTSHPDFPSYMQVFQERHGFIPDLSILDLLLNEGPETLHYLKTVTDITLR